MKVMKIIENLKIWMMSKITVKAFVISIIEKYIEKKQDKYTNFTEREIQKIKDTIYLMVFEC